MLLHTIGITSLLLPLALSLPVGQGSAVTNGLAKKATTNIVGSPDEAIVWRWDVALTDAAEEAAEAKEESGTPEVAPESQTAEST
ncbi:hypothetical protein FB567DRAFT_235049 [Paraphoma chrysanthemicola]|uniref:Uncharacterized protein n=1 Tax=Paraphoma chrysanthemicola TaxID=798071 RepID=A0A8K0W2Q4_9PLEO|nr:hypothetical protein FB567DRAFT_235049 [Paraphoma chrysanthemicola]